MNKKVILLEVLAILFFTGCVTAKEESGYNCVNGDCNAVSEYPQYLTLADCQSGCGKNGSGSVKIEASWTVYSCPSSKYISESWIVQIGLGYNSTDCANDAFFAQSGKLYSGTATFNKGSLAPGVYYYKATKSYHPDCGTKPSVVKSGAFTITAQNTTSIRISLN